MFVNADGWLVASPHRYVPIQGKNLVDAADLLGDYKLINLGKDINRTAKQSVYVSLNADLSITGEVTGPIAAYVDRCRIASPSTLDGIAEPFEGVLAWQWNEAAGTLVPVFTALSRKRRFASGARSWTSKPRHRCWTTWPRR